MSKSPFHKPCLDCGVWSVPGESRCASCLGTHKRVVEAGKAGRPNQKRSAARNVRRKLNDIGAGVCAGCGGTFRAADLQVDHCVAIGLGGADHEGNLQLLCIPRGCHQSKSRKDNLAIAQRKRDQQQGEADGFALG